MPHRFSQYDVFSTRTGDGNPLAVVHDADDLDAATMQRFAAWTNLSETTFVLRPDDPGADYRVRIFTPTTELPFAGHPTLGSCRAWLDAGGESQQAGTVVQECGIGLVTVRAQDGALSFAAPPLLRSGPVDDDLATRVEQIVGRPPLSLQWGDNGPGWVVAELPDAQAVRDLRPQFAPGEQIYLGVFGCQGQHVDDGYEVRAFFPGEHGICEDPATGSLNASVAMILAQRDQGWTRYTARQGTALGRDARIDVRREGDRLWVGGRVVAAVTGSVHL
ncbi:phenazine biosynthesis protein PhzF [Serinicoccus chungangensis]|uniref:Phenazine biosynthesis protein PhzF n=1 Tax=Serinicoccus chungangensis TaxID=767452 RepID=A0A0W8I512_9MICO|nr:PhzF family phenazine biosynthesis protein [Serinicoccus chungangensis]KUG53319.1 phenazine biosynthesis protein PhzF [Serinicoccus chungangensis]